MRQLAVSIVLASLLQEASSFLPKPPKTHISHVHALGASWRLRASVADVAEEQAILPSDEWLNSRPHHIASLEQYKQMHARSLQDPAGFWSDMARELYWEAPFDPRTALAHNFDKTKGKVFVEWFKGGRTNVAYNCLDRHVQAGLGDRVALITERNGVGEESARQPRSYTYSQALAEVSRLANALKALGVKKGDKVGIFMPMVAELPLAMLACVRIGAVHSVIFGGFSRDSLANRLVDSGCQVVITCDGVHRGKKTVPLFSVVDEAVGVCKDKGLDVRHTVVLQRLGPEETQAELKPGRDVWWHEATAKASPECPCEWLDAEDPLFILYTSGSTGKPKGVEHSTGGYMVGAHASFKHVFNVRPEMGDIWFSTADCGWITGHTYTTYGPMLHAATQVVFEGVPSFPDAGRLWQIVDKYQVTHLYTAPTVIRSLMREGDEHVKKYSRKSLKLLGSVGEPINPEAWLWYHDVVGEGRCPVADTWWQTETGMIAIAPLPVRGWVEKPACATLPFFSIEPALIDPQGKELEGECEGLLAIKSPWPSCIRGVHGNYERYVDTYFSYPGLYLTGDKAKRDKDGCYRITGRSDDVIIVSGHNIGTAEVEAALASHPGVSEAAVVGVPHEVKGSALYAFVSLKAGHSPSKALADEIRAVVKTQLGAFCSPDFVQWAQGLPKTMSGKIMRRILRKIAAAGKDVDTKDLGDTSTLSDPSVVKELIANHAFNPPTH